MKKNINSFISQFYKMYVINKTFILLIALSLYAQNLKSQTWNYVGSAQFAQGAEPDIEVYNGEVYVAFRDLSNNSKCTVMKFDGSNWVAVGNVGFTPDKIPPLNSTK